MDIHSEDERKGERELHIAEDRSDLTEWNKAENRKRTEVRGTAIEAQVAKNKEKNKNEGEREKCAVRIWFLKCKLIWRRF